MTEKSPDHRSRPAQRDQIFISYAREDKDWLDRLLLKLNPAKRNQTIQYWTDQDIQPGERWRPAVEHARDRTAVVVFLVSDHFLASDFIQTEELGHFLTILDEEDIALCWVRLDNCASEDSPLPERQAVGDIKTPWIALDHGGQDKALYDLAQAIKAAYRRATVPPPRPQSPRSFRPLARSHRSTPP